MIKKYLGVLIDVKLIAVLILIIAVSVILTLVFSDKIKDFKTNYKMKFYIYIFSFILIYALVSFLGYNKLFTEISDEFLFYQIASLLFGILNVGIYRWYFDEFEIKSVGVELLFSLIIILYSSVLFVIIYTSLNGSGLTFLMCSHFLMFIVPTGVYLTFNYMMLIPPREHTTWQIPTDKRFESVQGIEMIDILLITLLIEKNEGDQKYSSIRGQAPVRMDFGRVFYHTIKGYNENNANDPIQTSVDNENCNWVFFLQPKWYQTAKYVDARYYVGMNGITENSVIICKRKKKKIEVPKKKIEADKKVYGIGTTNNQSQKNTDVDQNEDRSITSNQQFIK